MLFSSVTFLYCFLPSVLVVYFVSPRRLKNSVIFLSSVIFYAWGEPKYLAFMLASITQGYIFGLLIQRYRDSRKAKAFLAFSVVFSLGLLAYCKYADFFIANFNAATGLSIGLLNLTLPIGISFYTFQIISYAVDVYRGCPAQKNYINLAAYIAMFPQLIAGPIVRYSDIAQQLESRANCLSEAAIGVRRFIIGLSKKILIANVLGELVAAFKATEEKSVLFIWLYAFAYMLQIYFDFSGYSDMAIGLGRILGFRFSENFNYPYVSASITEFWRRWHISLGSWFRDYLYIPLGGNRRGKARQLLNILIVWMATGLWHGAAWNFVLWGVLFAVLLVAEKLWLLRSLKKLKILNHAYVLFFVMLSFVIFDAASVPEALKSIAALFGAGGLPTVSFESLYYLKSYAVVLLIGIAGATPLPSKLACTAANSRAGKVINAAEPLCLIALLAFCTAFLIDGSFNPFLYFRF